MTKQKDKPEEKKSFGITGEVVENLRATDALDNLTAVKKIPTGLKWKLGLYLRQILDVGKEYDNLRDKLFQEYVARDDYDNPKETSPGSGAFELTPETRKEYGDKLKELRNTSIDIAGKKFGLSYNFVKKELSARDLAFLIDVIEFTDTEDDDD